MLFYELMRVKREYNAETRNQLAITQKMNRMQKQIDRTTKYYTSLFTQLENQAKCMQNNANVIFQGMTGGYAFNGNPTGCGTLGTFISQIFSKGDFTYSTKDSKGNTVTGATINETQFNTMMDIYNSNYGSWKDPEDNTKWNSQLSSMFGSDNEIQNAITAFTAVRTGATQMQTQMNGWVSQMSSMFQNGVSSWLECQKAALEAEQEQVLDALNYEETMLECDKTASDARCEELKAEKDSLKEQLKERIQEDAPSFGL